jgi:hypothetical protein
MNRTPPSRYIEMEAQKNSDFVLYVASQFPSVEIEDISFTREAGNLYWVDVELKNDRVFPTASDRDVQLGTAPEDKLMIRTASGVNLVAIPTGETQIDVSNPGGATTAVGESSHEFRLKGHETKTFRYLVEVSGSGGWVEFEVDAFFGGKATKRAQIR